MTIAVVNDVHVGPDKHYPGKGNKLSQYAQRELGRFLEAVSQHPEVDAVVELGDLIENESYPADARRYRGVLQEFGKIPYPTYHAVGNHEQVFLGEEDLRAWLGHSDLFYSFETNGYVCLVLHSEHRQKVRPRIGMSQTAWLKSTLARSSGPVVVFVHHPLDDQSLKGNLWFDGIEEECLVENRKEIRTILERSGKVVAVISAHAHWHNVTLHNGIPYITLQSLVERIAEDMPASSWTLLTFGLGCLRLQVFGHESIDRCIPVPEVWH